MTDKNMCKYMRGTVMCEPVRVCERENDRIVGAHAAATRCADAHKDLFTVSAPDDPPEDAGATANTHTNAHPHTDTHISPRPHISADTDTGCLRAPVRSIRKARFQTKQS